MSILQVVCWKRQQILRQVIKAQCLCIGQDRTTYAGVLLLCYVCNLMAKATNVELLKRVGSLTGSNCMIPSSNSPMSVVDVVADGRGRSYIT